MACAEMDPAAGDRCGRCQRLHAIGVLVDAIHLMPFRITMNGSGLLPGPQALAALDAVAFILKRY